MTPHTIEWWSDGHRFAAIIGEMEGEHTRVRLFAGPNPEHRAFIGLVTLRNDEVYGFLAIARSVTVT